MTRLPNNTIQYYPIGGHHEETTKENYRSCFGGTGGLTAVAEEPTGGFTVTGGSIVTDYDYADNVLTILKITTLTISGTTTTDRIEVESGVSANIIFDGVSITSGCAAFKIADNSTMSP